jgi:hypothetical protein
MEVPQEGVQTAMEQSFRTDLTPKQKLTNIVDAAVTGGAVGGALGGVGGVRAMKSVDGRAGQQRKPLIRRRSGAEPAGADGRHRFGRPVGVRIAGGIADAQRDAA